MLLKRSEQMENFRDEQRKEALERINELTKKFNLNSNMLESFKNGKVYGVDFTIPNDEKVSDKMLNLYDNLISEFEKEFNGLVYYYSVNEMECAGETWKAMNIFYVGQHKSDWEIQRVSENNDIYVYSYNLNILDYSELGFIGLANINGELGRTY